MTNDGRCDTKNNDSFILQQQETLRSCIKQLRVQYIAFSYIRVIMKNDETNLYARNIEKGICIAYSTFNALHFNLIQWMMTFMYGMISILQYLHCKSASDTIHIGKKKKASINKNMYTLFLFVVLYAFTQIQNHDNNKHNQTKGTTI